MYQGTKYSFALPVELTAKFHGLQYRNRTDDIKITFIVAASALYSIKNLSRNAGVANSFVAQTQPRFHSKLYWRLIPFHSCFHRDKPCFYLKTSCT